MAGKETANINAAPMSELISVMADTGTDFEALVDFEARARVPLFSVVKGDVFRIISENKDTVEIQISSKKSARNVSISRVRFEGLFDEQVATNFVDRAMSILGSRAA